MSMSEATVQSQHQQKQKSPSMMIGIEVLILKFFRKAVTWSCVYMWGYFGFSPGWLLTPLIFSVIRYQWKKEKEFKITSAQNFAEADEKEVILARVQDLPSWVFFPDFERSEWLNRVIDQLWPSIGHFITLALKGKLEPLIQKSLEKFALKDFKFDHVLLGNIPPRIGGIKCYEKNYTSRNEIILDLEVTWASDCDLSVQIKRMKASVLDLYIHGHLRVVLTPIFHNLPFIGGIQLYFLNNPSIDFEVGGLANVADLPGINSILRRVIIEQLARFVVLPNKISFPFVDDIPLKVFKCPQPDGVLRITVVEAKNLMHCDFGFFGSGQSDPYVVLSIGAKKYRTETIKKTVNPTFGETWECVVEIVRSQTLDIEVWDQDQGKDDDFMGRARVPIHSLAERGSTDMWITLEDASSGQVRIQTEWFNMSSNLQDYDVMAVETHGTQLSTGVLMVYVDSCRQLPLAKIKVAVKPDPIVQISVSSRLEEIQETRTVKYSRNPVYEEGFSLLVNNPEVEDLNLKVYDERSKATLGLLRFSLSNLMKREGMEYFNQPFKLSRAGCEAVVTLHLQLFFTKKVIGRRKLSVDKNIDNDSISVISLTETDTFQDQRSKKLSAISGLSVDSEDSPCLDDHRWTLNERLSTRDGSEEIDVPRSGIIGPRLQLSLRYEVSSQILSLTIHKALDLPCDKKSELPDPFVKVILHPDKPRRRKTEFVSSCLNPEWEETFSFAVPLQQLRLKTIEFILLDKKWAFSRSSPLCKGIIRLDECGNLTEEPLHNHWLSLLV